MVQRIRKQFGIVLFNLVHTARCAPLYKRVEDRSSTWQVLASGTQDLAALVGLFATDSVERYSVDYSRGYLGAAMAPGSMLGILGYVRALIKLAIGSEACVSAAFPTVPVRALLGTPDEDRLPGQELVTVTYIQRSVESGKVVWRRTKSIAHTKESMPATWAHSAVGRNLKPQLLLLEAGRQSKKIFSRQRPPYRWHLVVATLFTTGVNSFAIFLIGEGWTWSKYVASIITFVFLATSSLMWAYVYILEQVPLFSNDSTIWLDTQGEKHNYTCGRVSLRTDQKSTSFTFMESAGRYVLLPCSTLTQWKMVCCRIYSGVSAAFITVGYICQYIVVRNSSQNESLRWLLIQGGLTLMRVLVWVFPSRLIPKVFDQRSVYAHVPRTSFSDFQASSGIMFRSGFDDYATFQELELAATFGSTGVGLDQLSIPQDVLIALEKVDLASAFHLILECEPTTWVERAKATMSKKSNSWMIPPLLFRKLLLQRTTDSDLADADFAQRFVIGDWTCLLLDIAGAPLWKDSETVLVPLIRLTYRVDKLDEKGNEVERPAILEGFCTCFSPIDPTVNLVEIADKWVPFNQILRSPKDFLWGKFTHIRIVLETGEAGDASTGSELTVHGYKKRWSELRLRIEKSAQLQDKSKKEGPERSIIQFSKESILLDGPSIRPEVVKLLSK
ncbi:hypothetical protein P154DRAFT_221857 [Amniculicola lignicola CBS 123094]|uniref:Uncharacterized protein n=1 Tax=Amniculicola lignicola CBS 123094 TaxID=1392246 RepID=A0A6A5WY83_9PLEO|nr:hypothetical protein P154DRAFT_221857 [Amniculicola lignicola CBS 123094]